MKKPLRLLMVEDSEDDALLTILALRKGGYDPVYERVEDAVTMRKALLEKPWDVIICDYQMPQFNGPAAIAILKETGIDIPLIIVSGAIGEETAVECMRLGACDYIMKSNLPRLASAIERELKEAESRLQLKQAEEALRESEEKYRNLFENVNEAIFVAQDGKIVFLNPMTAMVTGYSSEELMKGPFVEFIHPDDQDMVIERHVRRIKGEELPHIYSFRIIHKDGNIRWVELNAVLINWKGKTATLNFLSNITERKQAEEQLKQTLESLRKAVGTTIQVMVSAVETRDPYTAGHQVRSADIARAIATEMGLSPEKIEGIHMAGSIHDIGKLSIPAEILSKPARLSEIEYSLVKEHASKGYDILKDVESPWPLAQIVYQHHERMDGSGYPRKLKGDEIIMEARIMAVADVVEAMASHRPYRPGLGIDAALNEIEKNRGIFYDNTVADACLRLFREKGFQIEGA